MKAFLEQLNSKRLRSYDADPGLLREHFGIEETVLAGGYGYRQILELVQNGADALLEARERGDALDGDDRIHVQLRGSRLYVANTGAPLSEEGLDALLRSHSSPKRGNQIGRFGLGFKSLLKLSGQVDVFTRSSGAIRFDPERCREELRQKFQVTSAPGLRLAWALPPDERVGDPICAELAWAETIVRVEVGSESLLQHIRQEIRSFPAEFLLFFPIAATLTLDDGQKAREVRNTIEGAEHILHDGDTVSRWRITAREVRITDDRAKADATHIHARESVPVSWAMPLEGRREEAGRFWAFFPTHTQTYLPGILNAPWKLNSDRNAIIGGEWNAALMSEAARLIADALPDLATVDDPARVLEAFPRQLDRKDDDAAPLVESLWRLLEAATVIPDGNGSLRRAAELWRHPKDARALAVSWQSLADGNGRRQFVHASCLERQRVGRLNALAERIKVNVPTAATLAEMLQKVKHRAQPVKVEEPRSGQNLPALGRRSMEAWFGLVASTEAEAALGVLQLAESFSVDVKPGEWSQARPTLAIIPTQSGRLVTAARVVLAPEGVSVPDRELVAGELQCKAQARRLLKDVLGVSEPDDQLWQSMLAEALRRIAYRQPEADETGWQALWTRLRLAPEGVRRAFLELHKKEVRVRRRDGRWAQVTDVLLPGTLVPDLDKENAGVLVDIDVHRTDGTLLDRIGVRADSHGTEELSVVQRWAIFRDWLDACQKRWFNEAFKGGSKPQDGYLRPLDGTVPKGLNFLGLLRGTARGRLTHSLFSALPEASKQLVKFGHSTRTDSYPKIYVDHPLPWLLLRHGEVQISSSTTVPLRAFVARRADRVLQRVQIWNQVEPALHLLEPHLDSVSVSPRDFRVLWTAAIDELATPESVGGDALTALWLGAAKDGVVPTELPSPMGRVPLSAAFVTTSADLASRARTPGRVVVVLDLPTIQPP